MKKFFYFLALAGLVTVSCSKETALLENDAPVQKGTYTYILNASVDSELTKTAYANETTFSWTKGDKISVLFHNGDDNRFFTLTAMSGGSASTQFKGEITEGYVLGPSGDGEAKWALYPASDDHVYNKDYNWEDTYRILFKIPEDTDLSGKPFSTNIPMRALGDANNNFVFSPIAAAYKFTFKVAEGISTVKLVVSQTSSYYLSGLFPFRKTDSGFLAFEERNSVGSGTRRISITRDVETVWDDVNSEYIHLATFYIPYRIFNNLTPTVTLYNMDNGFTIYTTTAKAAIKANDQRHITVIPTADLTSEGLGTAMISSYGINWKSVSCQANGDTGANIDAIRKIKATADAEHVYVYLEVLNDRLYSNASYNYSDRSYLYVGDGSAGTSSNWTQDYQLRQEGWLKYLGDPQFINWSNVIENNRAHASIVGDVVYMEMAIKRSAVSCLQSDVASTAYVGFMVTSCYNTGSTYGSRAEIGYAPAKNGSMLAVEVPAYVAP